MKIVQITTDNREYYHTYESKSPAFGAAPEALLKGFAEISDAEIHVISCLRQPVSSPMKLSSNIHYHSLIVPKIGWIRTGYQGCVRAIRALLREISPDIVHGQGTEKECAMAAVYSGFPNVVTIHGNMAELQRLGMQGHRAFGYAASLLETHVLKRTEGVLCNSSYTKELVAPRAKQTWLVPNAIRPEFFVSPSTLSYRASVPTVLNVGLIGPRKRQLEILRAIGDVVKRGFPMKIVFVGEFSNETPYGKEFAEELRKGQDAGYAGYEGFLSAVDLIALMDQSQGFVHFPSEEAFGLVVAEAMARGLKFFGANLGGIIDISEGVPGAELYNDFDSLINGLISWVQLGGSRQPLAAQSIAERYSPKTVAQKHLEIYCKVLKK